MESMMWYLDKESRQPLYRQLIDLIESRIERGELLAGQRLPSERQLAQSLGVNRSTVVHALEDLVARGVLQRRRGSGTEVSGEKWQSQGCQRINWMPYVSQDAFVAHTPFIRPAIRQEEGGKDLIDLASGELPLELAPSIEIPTLSWQAILEEEAREELAGYLPLRQLIRQQMAQQGMFQEAEQLLITSGAQQALFLITQCLLSPGDAIAMEAPSYYYGLSLFQSAGLRIFPLPMGHEGADPKDVVDLYHRHRIRMVFLNPSFQNPTGTLMPRRRREEMVALCSRLHIPIVEDNSFSQLALVSTVDDVPLKSLDPHNVLYIGSLSKLIGSSVRIGWLAGPVAVVQRLAEARLEMDSGLSIFPQVLAWQMIGSPSFQAHVRGLCRELRNRRDAFLQALRQYLPDPLPCRVPDGGYHLWFQLPREISGYACWQLFREQGVAVMPASSFGSSASAVRLTYARLPVQEAGRAALLVVQALHRAECSA